MQRRVFLKSAGLAAGTALAAPAIAQTGPEIRWRLASSFSTNLDLIWAGAKTFADAVREQTDGRFVIDVHPAGALVGALDVFDAVRDGRADCAQTALHYFWGREPSLVFATGAPFGMNAREHNAFFRHGGGEDLVNEMLVEHGLRAIAAGNTGCQMGGWFREELRGVSDLRGLKFRVSGFPAKVLQTLGVEPRAVGRGDIASSLASGALDAAAWVSPVDDEKLGLVKVAPNYLYPGWLQPSMAIHVLFDVRKWNELPTAYQRVLRSAADTANLDMQARYDAANPAALRRLAEAGAKLKPFPADVTEACYQAADRVNRDMASTDAKFRRMHDAYMDFRNDQYLWWQVAEYPFDNLMIRQRAKG